jgi:hypothetical protein
MCDGHSDVVVAAPSYLWAENRYTVALDGCIATVLPKLWERGVVTLGSCCGHGKTPPSLVLANGESPDGASAVLSEIDGRSWELFQWQLIDVTLTARPVLETHKGTQ